MTAPTKLDPALVQWYQGLMPAAQQKLMMDVTQAALRRQALMNPKYKAFQQRYFNDWPAFVVDCLDWSGSQGPAQYQLECIAELQSRHRIAVRGPHGLGKTALSAWFILAFALTRDGTDWKIPTTASAWRQLEKYLWPEIHKWIRKLNWSKIGREPFNSRHELLTFSLRLTTGQAFAVASDNPGLIEGAHADAIAYVFDESKSIQDEIFDAAEGAFSGAGQDTESEAYAMAISTPGEPHGRFYEIHQRRAGYEDWWVRHVSREEAIAAGRISLEWAEQRKRQWGATSAVYQNRVEGEFAAADEDSVIPLAWVEKANERWEVWNEKGKPGEFTGVGVDVGGGGETGDKTVEALAYDRYKIAQLRKHPRGDVDRATMETAGRTKGILDAYGGVAIIDVIGIGAGVYHRLTEQDCNVLPFNAAEKAERIVHNKPKPVKDKTGEFGFVNKRSAGWWLMRELLDPESGADIALPPDDELTGELTAPKWRVMSGARIQVESKDDIRKRIRRSTDSADAVIQIITGPELCQKPEKWAPQFLSV